MLSQHCVARVTPHGKHAVRVVVLHSDSDSILRKRGAQHTSVCTQHSVALCVCAEKRTMLAMAYRIRTRLNQESLETLTGTGPLGAPGGVRWITAADVLAAHANLQPAPRSSWTTSSHRVVEPPSLPLRDYQERAVAKGNPTPNSFVSGIFEMGCGLGKTHVGCELIRRSCAPAVVITQHNVSVDQWVRHMQQSTELKRIVTLSDSRSSWRLTDALPDVTIITYNTLVRASMALEQHKCSGVVTQQEDWLLWMLHCERFGVLVLDEVHLAAAEHFQRACALKANVVYGLSGSLVREDNRLHILEESVGPILYRYYGTSRRIKYEIITTPLSDEALTFRKDMHRRSAIHRTICALNPHKIAALHEVMLREKDRRIVVFCDARRAACTLYECLRKDTTHYHLLHGGITGGERTALLSRFASSPLPRVLITTQVSDAAINFPEGCVIVQLQCCNGSRQQEVQRNGRGTRTEGGCALLVHICNADTEEVAFVNRRVAFIRDLVGSDNVVVSHVQRSDATARDAEPLRAIFSFRIRQTLSRRVPKPKHARQSIAS